MRIQQRVNVLLFSTFLFQMYIALKDGLQACACFNIILLQLLVARNSMDEIAGINYTPKLSYHITSLIILLLTGGLTEFLILDL